MRPRLAIVATHPIQYHAPLFRRATDRGNIDVRVFYGWEGLTVEARDAGFARAVQWDVPLLDGYDFTFVRNDSGSPGTHNPGGIRSRELVPAIKAWKPDAVLVIGWAYVSHFSAMRAFHGHVPVLFRGDSTLLGEHPGPRKWLRRAALRYVYRHVDAALYAGTHNMRYFRAHGLRVDQLAWMPPAVSAEQFSDPDGSRSREAADWRARLGIPTGEPVALFVGKLDRVKAPELLLASFVNHCDSRAHLVFVGSGSMEPELREAARDSRNVHFVGFQNQSRMPIAYRLGDVLVLPSRLETWGLVVNEAMACGLPGVVSDRVGCAPDLVEAKGTGMVFPSGNGAALGLALQKLLGDADLRTAMGVEARRLIESWSIDVAADRLERAVAKACEQ